MKGDEDMVITCDASFQEDVQKTIVAVMNRRKRLGAIHNNAGTANASKPLHAIAAPEWDTVLEVNLKSIYPTTLYGIKHLKTSQGCILRTSSLVDDVGQEHHAAYVASKGAVNALAREMALDYAQCSFRVNAIAPAVVNAPVLQKWKEQPP